jgi:hypothetical protein
MLNDQEIDLMTVGNAKQSGNRFNDGQKLKNDQEIDLKNNFEKQFSETHKKSQ